MLGTQAGQSNLVSFNTFIGYGAGSRNETGNVNTFIGSNAGDVNVVAGGNTFIGSDTIHYERSLFLIKTDSNQVG